MPLDLPSGPGYTSRFTYRGVPLAPAPADLAGADVAIVGAPIDEMVTHRPGTRFGPRGIRLAYSDNGSHHMALGIDPLKELAVVDHGDVDVRPGDARHNHAVLQEAVGAVRSAGAVPIVLGGDHSIAYPDIAAVAGSVPAGSLAVVQFDSHADTATSNWGVEWSHGTPFRNLVDKGVLPGDRLIQVGLRGWWPYPDEWAWMRKAGIRWHRMEVIHERGIRATIAEVLDQIGDAEHLFLSVDIDVLDPAFAPGTGTPEPGGMTTHDLQWAVRTLVAERGLAGMDLVEVSPPYDQSGITVLAADRIVLEALSGLALRHSGRAPAPEDP